MLDGDEAGRVAAEGIADRLQRVVFHVNVITLPDGKQPDQLSTMNYIDCSMRFELRIDCQRLRTNLRRRLFFHGGRTMNL